MKKLFTILVAALCLVACEKAQLNTDKTAMKYIAQNAYNLCGESPDEVQKELTARGWQLNNIYQQDAGHYYAVYIYNRTAYNWKPFYFDDYAEKGQSRHYEELETLLNQSRIYGELEVFSYYGEVCEVQTYWMINSTKLNLHDIYETFGTPLYNEFIDEGGSSSSWSATLKNEGSDSRRNYTDHSTFIKEIRNFNNPYTHEHAYMGKSSKSLSYEVMGSPDRDNIYAIYSDCRKED